MYLDVAQTCEDFDLKLIRNIERAFHRASYGEHRRHGAVLAEIGRCVEVRSGFIAQEVFVGDEVVKLVGVGIEFDVADACGRCACAGDDLVAVESKVKDVNLGDTGKRGEEESAHAERYPWFVGSHNGLRLGGNDLKAVGGRTELSLLGIYLRKWLRPRLKTQLRIQIAVWETTPSPYLVWV